MICPPGALLIGELIVLAFGKRAKSMLCFDVSAGSNAIPAFLKPRGANPNQSKISSVVGIPAGPAIYQLVNNMSA